MHELGVVIEVVRTVLETAKENDVTEIDKVVLQIGQLSSCIPRYVEAAWPAAIDGTIMEHTELAIEVLPANARCLACGEIFNAMEHNTHCPACGADRLELLCGREFIVKEIVCA